MVSATWMVSLLSRMLPIGVEVRTRRGSADVARLQPRKQVASLPFFTRIDGWAFF